MTILIFEKNHVANEHGNDVRLEEFDINHIHSDYATHHTIGIANFVIIMDHSLPEPKFKILKCRAHMIGYNRRHLYAMSSMQSAMSFFMKYYEEDAKHGDTTS